MRSRDGLTEALLNVGNSIHQHKKHHPEASNSSAHTPPELQGSARTQLGEQPEAESVTTFKEKYKPRHVAASLNHNSGS